MDAEKGFEILVAVAALIILIGLATGGISIRTQDTSCQKLGELS